MLLSVVSITLLKIHKEIKKTEKCVVNSCIAISISNKQTYLVPVNTIVIIFGINNTGHVLYSKTYLADLYTRVFWQRPVELFASWRSYAGSQNRSEFFLRAVYVCVCLQARRQLFCARVAYICKNVRDDYNIDGILKVTRHRSMKQNFRDFAIDMSIYVLAIHKTSGVRKAYTQRISPGSGFGVLKKLTDRPHNCPFSCLRLHDAFKITNP